VGPSSSWVPVLCTCCTVHCYATANGMHYYCYLQESRTPQHCVVCTATAAATCITIRERRQSSQVVGQKPNSSESTKRFAAKLITGRIMEAQRRHAPKPVTFTPGIIYTIRPNVLSSGATCNVPRASDTTRRRSAVEASHFSERDKQSSCTWNKTPLSTGLSKRRRRHRITPGDVKQQAWFPWRHVSTACLVAYGT